MGAGSATGGGISDNSGDSYSLRWRLRRTAHPTSPGVTAAAGTDEIYVRRWNGSSWEEVGTGSASGGGISDNSGGSGSPSVAVAPDGTPYVAWGDGSGGDTEIYVRRWRGGSGSGQIFLPIVLKAPPTTYLYVQEQHHRACDLHSVQYPSRRHHL